MFLTILHNIEELKFVLLFGIIFTDIYNEAHMLEKICQKCELNMRQKHIHYEVSGSAQFEKLLTGSRTQTINFVRNFLTQP